MAWLDVLRGIAALAVLVSHTLPALVADLLPRWFNLGTSGVIVFFLVSGYIIPASLERRGCVRSFWIGRSFRLYPIYLLTIALVLVMAPVVPIVEGVDPLAHLTMLMSVVDDSPRIVPPMWTLSYEMAFYLLVTALFVLGLHRRSGLLAVGFGLAFVLLPAGLGAVVLQEVSLLHGVLGDRTPLAALAVAAAGLTLVLWGRLRVAGALILGVLALGLLTMGAPAPPRGLMILAIMFAGSAIYRWERGQTSGLWCALAVGAIMCQAHTVIPSAPWMSSFWIPTVLLSGGVFALAMLLRRLRFPRVLVWLGLISYSVYLLHHPLLLLLTAVFGDPKDYPLASQALLIGLYVGVVFGLSTLTYRYVELPMQRLGRRLTQVPSAGASTGVSASPVGESDERSLSSAAPAG
ncbi:hypothetical protein Plo01_21890 [Planobispora longispora]|uniref:Acyltransferase 3 domain-containing protein n=2 Tax=Planobispora longispora TaxID=28887 RepID=A0A8J3RJE9_9ACTN|nr:hypothetical protein Plo01_21890 [Planobispora longispora]